MANQDILSRRIEKVLPSKEGLNALLAKRKIRVYLGADPTGRLHIGHSIGLRTLMEFAEAGHEAIFLFGTGTVLVGDPSEREQGRKEVTQAEIAKNIKNWKTVASKVVDFSKVKVAENGKWLNEMKLKDLVTIASKISAIQLFKRDSFQRRLKAGDTVWYHETMYPLLQGYDSVKLNVDLEIGGSDQEFNMLMGRELQKKINNKEKYVLTTPMILGTDGEQMSKSSGNCVWLDDPADQMYGKLMSIPDEQTASYLTLCTDLTADEINAARKEFKNPRDLKAKMAHEITKLYHGEAAADKVAKAFDAQFKEGKIPRDIEEVEVDHDVWDSAELLVKTGLANSKSEAKRLLIQKGVKLNGKAISIGTANVKSGDILQVGKRHYIKIK